MTPCAIAARTPRVLRWLGGVRVRVHLALAISRAFVARNLRALREARVRVVQGLATPCAVAVLRRARIGSVDSSRCFKTRLFPARLHLNVCRMCLILLNTCHPHRARATCMVARIRAGLCMVEMCMCMLIHLGLCNVNSGGAVVYRNSCNSHAAEVPGGTKPLSSRSRCTGWRPAGEKLASFQQASGELNDEAWAGRVQSSSLRFSQEVQIGSGCAVTVSRLPSPLCSCVTWAGQGS